MSEDGKSLKTRLEQNAMHASLKPGIWEV